MSAAALLLAAALGLCTAPEPTNSGGGIFWLVERTSDGKKSSYPGASIADVDINSSIGICLRRQTLAATESKDVGSDTGQQDLARLTLLRETLDRLSDAVKATAEALALTAQATGPLTDAQLRTYQGAFKQLSDALGVRLQGYVRNTRGDDADSILDELALDPRGFVTASVAFLESEIAATEARLQAAAERGGVATLELTAFVGDPAVQVHLPGYDDLAPGASRPVEKTKFIFDARFQREYDEARRLASSIQRFQDANQLLGGVVKLLVERFVSSVAMLEKESFALTTAAVQLQGVAAAAGALTNSVQNLALAVRTVLGSLQSADAKDDPAAVHSAVVAGLQGTQGLVTAVKQAAQQFLGALAKVDSNEARALLARAASLSSIIVQLERSLAGSKEAVVLPTPAAFAVPVVDARDTELALIQTPREEGDIVVIRARLLNRDGKVIAGGETERLLRVRSRGLVADTGAVVLAVRGINPNPGPLVPAAGAYAVIRFKGWRSDGEADSDFFHALAPGLGVAMIAIPKAADGTTRLAGMATVQLFGDILQAAVGVDMNLEPYWGVGIGLHRIAGIGAAFP